MLPHQSSAKQPLPSTPCPGFGCRSCRRQASATGLASSVLYKAMLRRASGQGCDMCARVSLLSWICMRWLPVQSVPTHMPAPCPWVLHGSAACCQAQGHTPACCRGTGQR